MLAAEIKEKLGIKRVRADTLGYLQRSFLGCVSDVDQREARKAGEMGVMFAHKQNKSGSVTIRRGKTKTGGYRAEYKLANLSSIGGKTRVMPKNFIAKSGNNVTAAFIDYLQPLIGSGMAEPFGLKAKSVKKILG